MKEQLSTGTQKTERLLGWDNQIRLINELTIGRDGEKGHFRWWSCHG